MKARRLRFEEVPETGVRFWGSPERESVSGTERENLPDRVEKDVVYRDARVRLRIASKLADAESGPEEESEGENKRGHSPEEAK